MSGRFEGLTDVQWTLLEPLLPKDPLKKGKGKPHAPWRNICNSLFWILITGSRWCDLPQGPNWGSRSATHRWLGQWQEDGILDKLLFTLKEIADLAGMIKWDRLAVDGFFFQEGRVVAS
jgi:transposase